MSYLNNAEFIEISNVIDIYSIGQIADITAYSFDCGEAKEYAFFLYNEAATLDLLGISKTFIMIHNITEELIGYFTLSADSVKLTTDEKIDINLDRVSFMNLPAVKLGKLAINKKLSNTAKRKGYGSFAIEMAVSHAYEVLQSGVACRFVTVDADIEYDVNTPIFYEKNGFQRNLSRKPKPSDKTISMRRDIFE